jgi:hypothetical protein
MKQFSIPGFDDGPKEESKYTSKIKAPVYEPKNRKPHVLELVDKSKANRLINEIRISNVSDEEKAFLIEAARRHNVFNYKLIADYYAHSSEEMQHLMEHSALVIIDFADAIQYGYVKLADEIQNQYLNEYDNE